MKYQLVFIVLCSFLIVCEVEAIRASIAEEDAISFNSPEFIKQSESNSQSPFLNLQEIPNSPVEINKDIVPSDETGIYKNRLFNVYVKIIIRGHVNNPMIKEMVDPGLKIIQIGNCTITTLFGEALSKVQLYNGSNDRSFIIDFDFPKDSSYAIISYNYTSSSRFEGNLGLDTIVITKGGSGNVMETFKTFKIEVKNTNPIFDIHFIPPKLKVYDGVNSKFKYIALYKGGGPDESKYNITLDESVGGKITNSKQCINFRLNKFSDIVFNVTYDEPSRYLPPPISIEGQYYIADQIIEVDSSSDRVKQDIFNILSILLQMIGIAIALFVALGLGYFAKNKLTAIMKKLQTIKDTISKSNKNNESRKIEQPGDDAKK